MKCSLLEKRALANGNKRAFAKGVTYQEIKMVSGADMIVSADENLIALAKDVGLKVLGAASRPR